MHQEFQMLVKITNLVSKILYGILAKFRQILPIFAKNSKSSISKMHPRGGSRGDANFVEKRCIVLNVRHRHPYNTNIIWDFGNCSRILLHKSCSTSRSASSWNDLAKRTNKCDPIHKYNFPIDQAICVRRPCNNGGTCRESEENGSFQCICPKGFIGKTCDGEYFEDL